MTKTLKAIVLATLAATTAISAEADTTNLLQNVSVAFVIYSQGAPVVKGDNTNNIFDKGAFGTKALIAAVSQSGAFLPGDELVRATPVTNEPVEVTNLVPVGTNTLVITNTSTSTLTVSNELIPNGASAIPISNLNVTFGTDTEVIGGLTVTLGANIATNSITNLIVGTNTTVTATILTNDGGYLVGTNYVFVSNTLTNSTTTTNILGTAVWDIYNTKSKTLTALNTNVLFNIYTDNVYNDGTNVARIHGETVTRNHEIKFGTTDEIRTFILSNATWNIKLSGYASGHYVPVSLGGGAVSASQDFNWIGSGSGTGTNVPVVISGGVSEDYSKFLK